MDRIILKCLLPVLLCLLLTACSGQDRLSRAKSGKVAENTSVPSVFGNETTVARIEPKIIETDFSAYFGDYAASAVFYTAVNQTYEIYNLLDAQEQRSPCSTFKIASTLAALEYEIITADNSMRKWSGETFWNAAWNMDISLEDAFKTSCVWYYRALINEIGPENMQAFLHELGYGNEDISDWEGKLNQNNSNRSLTGFWIESSLLISPIEQVNMLSRILGNETSCSTQNVQTLKDVMKVEQTKTDITIYGKTGYGKLKNKSLDSWFIGMYELNSEPTYFAIHLSETEDPNVTSALAKEIAIQIIADKCAIS